MMSFPRLIRSAAIDNGPIICLRNLLFGPAAPEDLSGAEIARRAMITADRLWHCPRFVTDYATGVEAGIDINEYDEPIGDAILDYEFNYDEGKRLVLPKLSPSEADEFGPFVEKMIVKALRKPADKLLLRDVVVFDREYGMRDNAKLDLDTPVSIMEDIDSWMSFVDHLTTVIRFHRAGAVVFSNGLVQEICGEYLFSTYPASLFGPLDREWAACLRKVLGPGIGVSVPPVLSIVLTRAKRRGDLSRIIRDLRREYASSRRALWDKLEHLWCADGLREQLRVLEDLESASEHLFRSAFPQRFGILQTAFSVATKVADAKPYSAMEEVGRAALGRDGATSRVSAIGFLKQLSGDIRKIEGTSTSLRRVLTTSEIKAFSI